MPHRYGGPWTEVKLDAVQYYLECYAKALSAAGMETWYIDAFAGTGDRETERTIGGLLEGGPLEQIIETLDGSARRAMKVQPRFKHFIFIEMDSERVAALEEIKKSNPSFDIKVFKGDANEELKRIVDNPPWSQFGKTRSRGVVFLDPYALHVDWNTLRSLAATKLLDVWYLFPLRDVVRQLAHNMEGIGPKAPKLDAMLGPTWRDLYVEHKEAHQSFFPIDLFPEPELKQIRRNASQREIEQWWKGRLKSEFAYVSDPLPILQSPGRQTFSLFLCVSNPGRPAIDLAKKFASYVKKKYGK
jgi:three-Cys-motif partner protein